MILLAVIFILGLIAPLVFIHFYGGEVDQDKLFSKIAASSEYKTLIEITQKFPLLRVMEFISGIALCVGFQKLLPLKRSIALLTLAGGLTWVLFCVHFPYILLMGTLTMPGFLLIILGAASLPFPSVGSSPPWLVKIGKTAILLGNASYAVYLFHEPIIFYLLKVNKYAFHFLSPSPWASFTVLTLVVTLVTTLLSIAIYLFYEEPARKWIVKKMLFEILIGRSP